MLSGPGTLTDRSDSPPADDSASRLRLEYIRLDEIDADHDDNDRIVLDADKLNELAHSIAHVGLINPITLQANGERYRLIAGFRRLEAVRLIGRVTIAARIVPTDQMVTAAARLAENLVRADLTPVEEARAVAALTEEFADDAQRIAARLNRSVNWVRHRQALANYPHDVLQALHTRAITLAVADEMALVVAPNQRSALLQAAIRNGCTARQALAWRTHANVDIGGSTSATTKPDQPLQAPAPTRVLKECIVCAQEHDITEMSYVALCRPCTAQLSNALNQPQQSQAPAQPSG